MIKRIVLAYDGSKAADRAFGFALDLAVRYAADLDVLAVAGPSDEEVAEAEDESVVESSRTEYRHALEPLYARAASAGIAAQFDVVVGEPAKEILRRAKEVHAELIVVGHPGHGLFSRVILGSVAQHVIDHAPCAVLVSP